MAGTAILGWEVGTAISKWLDKETGYIDKGGSWMANTFTGADKKMAEAAKANTTADVDAAFKSRGVTRRAKQMPGGDLRISGQDVMTTQAMDDYSLSR
jgi:hypothetical protein